MKCGEFSGEIFLLNAAKIDELIFFTAFAASTALFILVCNKNPCGEFRKKFGEFL